MLRAILTCGLCMVGAMALGDELSPKARKVLELGEVRRRERLSELEGGVLVLKARLHEQIRGSGELGTGVPANVIAKDHAVKATQERIEAVLQEIQSIRSTKIYYPNIVITALHPGDIGIPVDQFGVGVTARISKIIDEKNMIVSVDSQPVWLSVGTKGLKVGKQVSLTMPFEVLGTSTHPSVDRGSKKIFVLKQFHLTEDEPAPQQVAKSPTEQAR